MADTNTLMTADQLLEIANGRRVELVRGEVIEMPPVGWTHGRTVVTLSRQMDAHAAGNRLGDVVTEVGFVLSRNPDVVLAPDIAFVTASRTRPVKPERFFEGPPDLAVEVVSPADRASELQQKIGEYLRYGARLVWLVDPQSETVTAYHPSGAAHVYTGDQAVPGEDILPGFSFRPADLFRSGH